MVDNTTLKKACRQIKAVYTGAEQEHGHANYMTYWARNGNFKQICDTSAYSIKCGSQEFVNNTYLSTDFWSKYEGLQDPVTGADYTDGIKAVGW